MAIQIDRGVPVTFDTSMDTPVTPPSMKLLESRNPWIPIPADRIPSRIRTVCRSACEKRFTAPSYDGSHCVDD